MTPKIPEVLSLEACIGVEHDMIYHDPEHYQNTANCLGHPVTDEKLAQHWFGTGASAELHALFERIGQERAHQPSG